MPLEALALPCLAPPKSPIIRTIVPDYYLQQLPCKSLEWPQMTSVSGQTCNSKPPLAPPIHCHPKIPSPERAVCEIFGNPGIQGPNLPMRGVFDCANAPSTPTQVGVAPGPTLFDPILRELLQPLQRCCSILQGVERQGASLHNWGNLEDLLPLVGGAWPCSCWVGKFTPTHPLGWGKLWLTCTRPVTGP